MYSSAPHLPLTASISPSTSSLRVAAGGEGIKKQHPY
jgi:hypothetical protein